MNKKILGIISAAVLGVAIIGIIIINILQKPAATISSNTAANIKPALITYNACKLLPIADANIILSDQAIAPSSPLNDGTPTTGNDLSVSNCSYADGDNNTVSLLARSAVTSAAVTANKDSFEAAKTGTASTVSGLGDEAYWSPDYGQLNILKGNVWLIVRTGGIKPTDHTLDNTQPVADQIVTHLDNPQ